MKKIKTFDTFFLWSAAAFVIVIVIICFFPILFTSYGSRFNFTTTGLIGDTIGGIMGPYIAIAAAALTFLAFWVQYKANEQQREDIKDLKKRAEKERLETNFFEMIKFHRDNVGELSYSPFSGDNSFKKLPETSIARKVYKVIFDDFIILHRELNHFFTAAKAEDIYEEKYLNSLLNNSTIIDRGINLVIYAKIDILYCILYFGLGSSDNKTIRDFFNNRYKFTFFDPIVFFASMKPKKYSTNWDSWSMFNESYFEDMMLVFNTKYNQTKGLADPEIVFKDSKQHFPLFNKISYCSGDYFKYYGGHQFRLGHYFRHLYQTVTFINDIKFLNYDEKYSKIKLLRGQLSTFEQSMIFLNSVSVLGRLWELENRENASQSIEPNYQLITKYNFIKNILSDKITDDISVSHFYPLVEFEANFSDEKKNKRELLEKKFS